MVSHATALRPVHPRIRGEHGGQSPGNLQGVGSSPHTRGTSKLTRERMNTIRFIPAYAGNIYCGVASFLTLTVHPRIRGEHCYILFYLCFYFGSSPHTRGTYPHTQYQKEADRFIPAYAGNIQLEHDLGLTKSVHPRIRGEHRSLSIGGKCSSGSSPHTRGT